MQQHALYKQSHPIAHTIKIILLMLIGSAVFFLSILKVMVHLFFTQTAFVVFKFLLENDFLEIVGDALALSAGIEFGYMLFTEEPDEAIIPLIYGFSSAILFIIHDMKNPITYEKSFSVLIFAIILTLLFYLRERFLRTIDPKNHLVAGHKQSV